MIDRNHRSKKSERTKGGTRSSWRKALELLAYFILVLDWLKATSFQRAMASLQDVLAAVPAALIDAHNQLIPGVQASPENLNTLLEHIKKEKHVALETEVKRPSIGLCAKGNKLFAAVKGPEEIWHPGGDPSIKAYHTPVVARGTFKCSADGLLQAICWAKKGLKRLRDEGVCPDCMNRYAHPRKKLKAEGMPKCCECLLKAAVGLE